jgi:hypothetical protein
MIQIKVWKNGENTHGGLKSTMEEALQFVSQQESIRAFGSPAVYQDVQVLISPEVRGETQIQVSAPEFNEFGEEITPATFITDPDGIISAAVYETQSQLVSPATYTVEIIDISAQEAQKAINVAALAYLASTDWMIIRASEGGPACSSGILSARAAARLSIIH